MVNVHSKVIVLDPFGEHPVVMTGSHNLGFKASQQNDDNLCIVEGSAALAAAYAVNIIAIFRNYRWNSSVTQHQADSTFWHGPVDNDKWQADYMTGDHLAEIRFWLGEEGAPTAAKAAAAGSAGGSGTAAAGAPVKATRPRAHSVSARGTAAPAKRKK